MKLQKYIRSFWFVVLAVVIPNLALGDSKENAVWEQISYSPNLNLLPYYELNNYFEFAGLYANCTSASNVGSKNIKSDKATLYWDNVTSVSWEYVVQVSGGTLPTGSGISTSVNEVIVDKVFSGALLTANTDYEFYIRTNCGVDGFGNWEGPYDFTTLCLSFAPPFKEGFESASQSMECWTIWDIENDAEVNPWGTENIWYKSSDAYVGSGSMTFSGGWGATHDDWLISPSITLGVGNYAVTYYYKTDSYYDNEFEVLLSKDGMDISKFSTVLQAKSVQKVNNFKKKVIYITGITGDVHIAWRVLAEDGTEIVIDEVSVEKVDCLGPNDDVIMSDIQTNKAKASWNDDVNKEWEYFVQESGGGEPVGSGSVVKKNSTDITKTSGTGGTNLKPNTEYEFYVRSSCGPGMYSGWVGPIVFRTPCSNFPTPFWEGFNSTSETIDCWTIVDNNEDGDSWTWQDYDEYEGDGIMNFYGSDNDDWLISPTFTTDITKIYRLKYHIKADTYYNNEFEVLMSSKGLGLTDFTNVLSPKGIFKLGNYVEKKYFISGVSSVNVAWHVTSSSSSGINLDNVFFEEVIGCPEPLNLGVKDLKEKSGMLTWTDDFKATSWEYWVQAKGGKAPTGAGTVVTKKEATVSTDHAGKNLTPNTEYEFYVRTVCSDGSTSVWSGPFVFRTICDVVALPFWEGFNKNSPTIYCWNILDINGDGGDYDGKWMTIDYNQFEGSGGMKFSYGEYDFETDDWLISPNFDFDAKKIYRLKYHYKTDTYSEESNFEVLASNSGRAPSDFTKEIVADATYLLDNYKEHTVFITNFGGEVALAWHVTDVGYKDIYIDNVFVEEVLTCPEPLWLDVKDEGKNKATISWTDDFKATSWEYFVQEQGKGVPASNGTVTSKKENVVDKEQSGGVLKPNTDYEFYVRTVCGGGTYSVWAGPFTFTTTCDVYSTPFWDGFNSDTKTYRCWTILDENGDGDPEWGGDMWELSDWNMYEGDRGMYFSVWDDDLNDDWLVSPTISMDNSPYILKYHYKSSQWSPGEFEVLLSSGGVSTDKFTTVLIPEETYDNEQWEERVLFFNGVKGDVNIAWRVITDGETSFGLDNVHIKKIDNCPEPYYVKVTGETATTLSLEWQQTGGVTEWEVIVVNYNEDETATPIKKVNVTGTPSTTITGLDPGKSYRVYVRAKCGSGNTFSDWSTSAIGGTLVGANDECSGALNIPINSGKDCLLTVSGSLNGATKSSGVIAPTSCGDFGSPKSKDVWFEFTAISSTHTISVQNLISLKGNNPYLSFAIYDQPCSGMTATAFSCFGLGVDEFQVFKDLVPGQKYYVRVGAADDETDFYFDLCITSLSYLVTSPSGVDYTVEELVEDVLVLTNCDLVSNITYRTGTNFGGENGIGYFNKNNSDFGFEEGVILATNGVRFGMGPGGQDEGNDSETWLGDDDLKELLLQNGEVGENYNASVIEFDFVPIVDTLKFDFIFASNEYGVDFQCTYSDVFAFFLTDLTTDEVSNLAVIPGTNTQVSVTTIRDAKYQGTYTCGDSNKEYFDKYYGESGLPAQNNAINFGGRTVPMTAKSAVVPGRKYHIKLAIADHKDSSLSAAVFLNGGSFNLGNLDLGADLTVENGTALCSGEAKTIKTGLGTEGIEIKWYKDDVLIVGENAPDIEISESGTYKVVAKYVDINCEVTGEITAEIFPAISTVVKDPKSISICRNSLNSQQIDLSLAELDMFGSA
ncbi:choice-of-anchor J domain-containing protein, partial [Myroides guanonis]